jgi:predicted Zn-dependent peptidase
MFSSRLVDSLRERLGYTYSPRSSVSHASVASQFSITLDVGTEVTAPALVALRHELGRAVALGFDEAEVEGARRYALGTLAFALSTQAGLASQLASLLSTGSEPDHLSRHAAGLAAATRDDVNSAARTLLSPVGLTAVALGDASAAFDALAAVEAAELV